MWNTPNPWEILLLIALSLSALVIWRLMRAPSLAIRDRKKRFAGRSPMSADNFYREFYGDSGLSEEIVSELRSEVAKVTGVPEVLLRPSDRFRVELAVASGLEHFDESPDDFHFSNREREKRLGIEIDLAKFETLDDYIRNVGRLEMQRGTAASR